MNKLLKPAIALCIIGSLFIFIRATDFEKVNSSLQQVGYKFSVLLLVTCIAYFLGTLSWQFCLGKKYNAVSTVRLFFIRHIGETVSLVNPTSIVGGETLKAFMLKDDGIEKKTVIASILSSRIIMIITQLLLFTLAVILLTLNEQALEIRQGNHATLFYSLAVFLLFTANLWLFWRPIKAGITSTKAGSRLKHKTSALRLKIREVMAELQLLFKHHKKMLFFACVFAALHWLFGSLEFYFILKFLGVKASITQALLVDMGIIFFKTAGAFIPGQIGIEEYGNKVMLMTIGIPGAEIWITASILRRTRQLIWIAFGIGIYFLLFKKRGAKLQEV